MLNICSVAWDKEILGSCRGKLIIITRTEFFLIQPIVLCLSEAKNIVVEYVATFYARLFNKNAYCGSFGDVEHIFIFAAIWR